MKPLEELRRENAETWHAVVEKLRAMGLWLIVEYEGDGASGPVALGEVVSLQTAPGHAAAHAACDVARRMAPGHSVSILPPTRAPVRTLGEYVRECAERAERDLPITYRGTE